MKYKNASFLPFDIPARSPQPAARNPQPATRSPQNSHFGKTRDFDHFNLHRIASNRHKNTRKTFYFMKIINASLKNYYLGSLI
ncbi:MAG: hypothetical protein AB2693_16185 [Candidatus Thiodiazotropha sp.]